MVESTRDSVKHFNFLKCFNQSPTSSLFTITSYLEVGGDKRDRTADLLNAIQALSQLSYTPIFTFLLSVVLLQKNGVPKWTRFAAAKPRRLQQSTGLLLRAGFRVSLSLFLKWWAKMDSNHRPHDYQSCALAS